MKKNLKDNLYLYVFIILFILGLSVMCYPVYANSLHKKDYREVIKQYKEIAADYDNSKDNDMIKKAVDYNNSLTQTTIYDAFSNPTEVKSTVYKNILNVNNNGVMGYISIPKIDERIPIYHGTSSKVLGKGVGHLEGSSFPVGGKGTHAILSAHRGLPSAKLFTDLNQLEKGDMFYIYVLDKKLAYVVDQIKVVEPQKTEDLALQEGYDYVTLVTCTPYAINSHRLLVRGVRTSYLAEDKSLINSNKSVSTPDLIFYFGLFFALIIIICFIVFIVKLNKNKTNKANHNTSEAGQSNNISPSNGSQITNPVNVNQSLVAQSSYSNELVNNGQNTLNQQTTNQAPIAQSSYGNELVNSGQSPLNQTSEGISTPLPVQNAMYQNNSGINELEQNKDSNVNNEVL